MMIYHQNQCVKKTLDKEINFPDLRYFPCDSLRRLASKLQALAEWNGFLTFVWRDCRCFSLQQCYFQEKEVKIFLFVSGEVEKLKLIDRLWTLWNLQKSVRSITEWNIRKLTFIRKFQIRHQKTCKYTKQKQYVRHLFADFVFTVSNANKKRHMAQRKW